MKVTENNCPMILKSIYIINYLTVNNKFKDSDTGKKYFYLIRNLNNVINSYYKYKSIILDSGVVEASEVEVETLEIHLQYLYTKAITTIITDYIDDMMISNHRISVIADYIYNGDTLDDRIKRLGEVKEIYKVNNTNFTSDELNDFLIEFDITSVPAKWEN